MRYVSDDMPLEVIQKRFNERLADFDKTKSAWLTLCMFDKETGERVGLTGFFSEWLPYQQAELGFLLCPKFQGKGLGKESTSAVMSFAFEQCEFHKIKATVTQGNAASSSLLTSLGFTLEGTLRDNYKINNQWCNDLKYSMLRHEFQSL